MPAGLIGMIMSLDQHFRNGLANKCGVVGVVHATSDRMKYYETIWIEKLDSCKSLSQLRAAGHDIDFFDIR